MKNLGILVFGHTRPFLLADTLKSLQLQDALKYVDVWIDGAQASPELKQRVEKTQKITESFPIKKRFFHNGQLGFRKLILLAMQHAINHYENIIFLEDDCFPTHTAVSVFMEELEAIRNNPEIFSTYGHHFGMAEDSGRCSRFQGWGWATTAEKLAPYLTKLFELYSMYEAEYLQFTEAAMTPELLARLDVTPPRLPSVTLKKFFAWDETLALLTAMDNKCHKPTSTRVIYNCGFGKDASRFRAHPILLRPPYNMISHDDVWKFFK